MFKTFSRCKSTAKTGDMKVFSPTPQEEKPIQKRKFPSGGCTCYTLEPARVGPYKAILSIGMSQMKKRHYGGEMLVVSSSDDDIEYHGDTEDGGYGVEGHHDRRDDAEQVTC